MDDRVLILIAMNNSKNKVKVLRANTKASLTKKSTEPQQILAQIEAAIAMRENQKVTEKTKK